MRPHSHRRAPHARRWLAVLLAACALALSPHALRAGDDETRLPDGEDAGAPVPPPRPILRRTALFFGTHSLFLDPNPSVVTKEFAAFYNEVPAPTLGQGRRRGLFHIIYQRSVGPQKAERLFGHAWSLDLRRWAVDTAAFAVDTTQWNAAHVWSPSLVQFKGRTYLFYTGVNASEDQSIGYVSTALLDTIDTDWSPDRTQVLRASDTRWAVPDPSTYSGQTQFRDAFVMNDPADPERLLMFYSAHDSVDFAKGRGGLACGVARSAPGRPDVWEDLGYYQRLHPSVTKIDQLEGPHVFWWPGAAPGSGRWCLAYSNAGTPPGETGSTTIRYSFLNPGYALTDTSAAAWTPPATLQTYLGNPVGMFGWSGSEALWVNGLNLLMGFTAWGPNFQGIAFLKATYSDGVMSVGQPLVTEVDEYRSPARALALRVEATRAREVRFAVESPHALDASLEVYDVAGRRVATVHRGALAAGTTRVSWRHAAAPGSYFARLRYAGGVRVAPVTVLR